MKKTYRDVACGFCIWRDYYACDHTRPSYPDNCPACGLPTNEHQFFTADFPFEIRNALGRDNGIRSVFGSPVPGYKNLRDRKRNRNYPAYMNV